jgi:hypothetical protein
MSTLRRVVRTADKDASLTWIANCGRALEVGLVGYLVSGMFLSMSYFDLFYHFVAIAVVLKTLSDAKQLQPERIASAARAVAG